MVKSCALVGNQNSGKTLLFNVLTGLNQKVGNWPGVTVERKDGLIKGTKIHITDLPGIYSLSPYTAEEEISRTFIVNEKPDLIINIIDSTSIERALYLTTQLMELDTKVLIVLNMEDILAKKGYHIDIVELEKKLQTKCISISALKKTGIKELINIIKNGDELIPEAKNHHIFPLEVENVISDVIKEIDPNIKEKRFAAIKVIERDNRYYNRFFEEKFASEIKSLELVKKVDSEQLIASLRYDYIVKVRDEVVLNKQKNKETITNKIDKVLLNKWAAIPIFLIVIILVYLLSVGLVGGATVGIVDMLFNGGDNSTATKYSIKTDEAILFQLNRSLERWLNRKFKNKFNGMFKVKLLDVTCYNKEEVIAQLTQGATLGLPVKMKMAAVVGQSTPLETEGLTFLENDILGLHDKWIPLNTSYTQSGNSVATEDEGGRPEVDDTELSETGQSTRENDSNDRG